MSKLYRPLSPNSLRLPPRGKCLAQLATTRSLTRGNTHPTSSRGLVASCVRTSHFTTTPHQQPAAGLSVHFPELVRLIHFAGALGRSRCGKLGPHLQCLHDMWKFGSQFSDMCMITCGNLPARRFRQVVSKLCTSAVWGMILRTKAASGATFNCLSTVESLPDGNEKHGLSVTCT